jgi:hypothetical protein
MLTQKEYQTLMRLAKSFEDSTIIELGPAPQHWTRQLKAVASTELFKFDFNRGRLELRYTYNLRRNQTTVLFRYDQEGRHTNPDGEQFSGPHVHIYKESYDDKFAYPVSEIGVLPSDSIAEVLAKVAVYCNIVDLPSIQNPLF